MKLDLAALEHFIKNEQRLQTEETRNLWRKPLGTRIAEGDALGPLTWEHSGQNPGSGSLRIRLSFQENASKFRRGEYLRLSRDAPGSESALKCILESEEGNQVTVTCETRYSGAQIPMDTRGTWVLDVDLVDTSSFALGALATVAQRSGEPVAPILEGRRKPVLDPSILHALRDAPAIAGFDGSQKQAFLGACATDSYFIIQGPPGTGKTRVLAAIVGQLVQSGERVLVCAFTHRAINNALRAIVEHGRTELATRIIKIGKPHYAEDLVWDGHEIRNTERFQNLPEQTRSGFAVVGATCLACQTKQLQDLQFDTVVFDEASQLTIPLAMMAMLKAKKQVFIGDHKQMPPIIQGQYAQEWLQRSIFETIFAHEPGVMLDTTYRMNQVISSFPSRHFYGSKLKTSTHSSGRRLALTGGSATARTPQRDTQAGSGMGIARPQAGELERQHPQLGPLMRMVDRILSPEEPSAFVDSVQTGCTIRSESEAGLAAILVCRALGMGVAPSEIAVVAPYRAQCRLINSTLDRLLVSLGITLREEDRPVVDTVERIQGQERELVLVSLTVSAPAFAESQAEFFFMPNRLNVAVTRPRTKRIILGNPGMLETLAHRGPEKIRKNVGYFMELRKESVVHFLDPKAGSVLTELVQTLRARKN